MDSRSVATVLMAKAVATELKIYGLPASATDKCHHSAKPQQRHRSWFGHNLMADENISPAAMVVRAFPEKQDWSLIIKGRIKRIDTGANQIISPAITVGHHIEFFEYKGRVEIGNSRSATETRPRAILGARVKIICPRIVSNIRGGGEWVVIHDNIEGVEKKRPPRTKLRRSDILNCSKANTKMPLLRS